MSVTSVRPPQPGIPQDGVAQPVRDPAPADQDGKHGPRDGGPVDGPGPVGPPVGGRDPLQTIYAEIRSLEANPPRLEDYPPQLRFEYRIAVANHHERLYGLRQDLFEAYKAQAAESSPTSAAIIAAAEEAGTPVIVMGDADYAAQYPGTGGVTINGTVYVPEGALASDTGVLEHELLHALLGETADGTRPLAERIEEARALFDRIGLSPDDGERWARSTDGWSDGAAADHVQTFVSSIAIQREKDGLPPLDDARLDQLYELAATREAALATFRHTVEFDDGSKLSLADFQDRGALEQALSELTPEQLHTLHTQLADKWNAFPQGRQAPATGDNDTERLLDLFDKVTTLGSEEPLQQFRE